MKSSLKNLPKAQVELEIELSPEEFADFSKEAVINLGKEMEMEGFRKGRVPSEIIEKKLSKEKILMEAADLAVKESFIKAVLEKKLEVLSQPQIEILKLTQGDPFSFRAKFFVLPEINLADYRKIASSVGKKEVSVGEKEIDDALLWLQRSRAKFTLKNSGCQPGDWLETEYSSPQIENNKQIKDAFVFGQAGFIPGFEENLAGLKEGEEKEFSVNFPENYFNKDLAGTKVDFKVKVKSVQNMELPELNDEFAKNTGSFANLEALRKSVKEDIIWEKEKDESQRVRQEILDKIADKSQIEIPDILAEKERDKMLENLKQEVSQNLGVPFGDYLARIKKSEPELSEQFLIEARQRIKRHLVLREIAKKENLVPAEEEIKEESNKILRSLPDTKKLDPEQLKNYTEEVIKNEKTLQFLEKLAK